VKTPLSTSLLALALVTLPAAAADVKPAPAPAPLPGPVMDAIQSAMRELQAADDARLPLPARLDREASYQFTPATAAKLRAVFGNDHPYSIEHRPGAPGRLVYRARLQPLHYVSQPDAGVDWSEAVLDLDMDKAGKTLVSTGKWNSIEGHGENARVSARGMTLSGHNRRGPGGMWFGDFRMHAAGVRIDTKQDGAAVSMDDLNFSSRTVERPKTVDVQFQYGIGAISAAGEKVEDVRFAMRLVNIDKAALVSLQAATEKQRAQMAAVTQEQQATAMKPLLLGFGKAALTHGAALEIDEISARYHGNKASIRGRIGLVGAVEADFQDVKALVRKIVARFEIRVPVAIVRDISGAVARKQAAQQAGQAGAPANEQGLAQVSQSMTDVVIGKLVGGGYARVENDVLVSQLELRNGTLRANGKEIGLPKVGANAAAGQPVDVPPDTLQARRIEESCRLPDYPEAALRGDLTLRAGFVYRVDAEGRVHDARVAAPSGFPAWDTAALATLAQCRYIPALQNGKPIELEMRWDVVREAGSARPRDANPAP
jgi:TonB family protein